MSLSVVKVAMWVRFELRVCCSYWRKRESKRKHPRGEAEHARIRSSRP